MCFKVKKSSQIGLVSEGHKQLLKALHITTSQLLRVQCQNIHLTRSYYLRLQFKGFINSITKLSMMYALPLSFLTKRNAYYAGINKFVYVK